VLLNALAHVPYRREQSILWQDDESITSASTSEGSFAMAMRARGFAPVYPLPQRVTLAPELSSDQSAQPSPASAQAQVAWSEPHFLYWPVKRAFDIVVAVIAILLLLVLLIPISVLLLVEDGGPPIYRGEAVGYRGRRFKVYKIRTMRPDADEYIDQNTELKAAFLEHFKLADDPRVHSKTSLDELPQAINVLLGDMTWVGPRYVKPEELERYGSFATLRLTMRPGITGLWQISGRSNTPYPLRTVYDRTYYYTRSLWTDLKIFSLTIPSILRRDGAV
jgi:lipopolysaccharide/colanic/teichoic acid biosynthesis glycosyltransferase